MAAPAVKPLIPTPFFRHTFGVDQASSFSEMPEEAAVDSINIEAEEAGLLGSRPGCSPFLLSRLANSVTKIFDFKRTNGDKFILAWNGDRVDKIESQTPAALLTGISTPGLVPGVTVNNDYLVWGDGTNPNKKTDGTTVWNLSVPTAGAFPTLNTSVAGSITLTTGQKYVITFFNSVTQEEGNPFSPLDLSGAPDTGAITNKRVDVTRPSLPGSDPQVDKWRIYKTEDGGGTFFFHAEVAIGTSIYNDNVTIPATDLELSLDNDEAPLSEHWCEYLGSLFCVPVSYKTKLQYSKPGNNSAFPPENEVFVGRKDNEIIVGIKNINNLLWIVKEKSTWIMNGHPLDPNVEPIKISDRGGVHKDGFDGSDQAMFTLASNGSVYKMAPTDFNLSEIRYTYRSYNIQKTLDTLTKSELSKVRVLNYASKTKNQIFFGIPFFGVAKINRVLIYDTVLAKGNEREESWWPFRFMFDITSMDIVTVDGEDVIFFGDSSGNVFKYPDDDGDGAQENGTATSGGASTLTDSTQSWTTDEFKGIYVTLIGGTGAGQDRKVISNTATQLTVDTPWVTNPAAGTEYTIGGYLKEWNSNWKKFNLEAMRKRMRQIRCIGRQGGNFPIEVFFRRDFESAGETITRELNLAGTGSIWLQFNWGVGTWGLTSVVRANLKFKGKFNSCQFGFRNRLAGQDFRIEGFTTMHQDLYLGNKP